MILCARTCSDTDEEEVPSHSKRKSMMGLNGHSFPQGQEEQGDGALPITTPPRKQLQRIISIEEDHLPDLLQEERRPQLHQWSEEEVGRTHTHTHMHTFTHPLPS